ncbi:MAG: trypsin-like peptidase domain-containing protein [Phycisphaeraceae bacterium]
MRLFSGLTVTLSLLTLATLLLHGAVALSASDEALQKLDFRKVVSESKARVFPAVVYIKVLQETFEQGKKVSQEVSGSGVLISPRGEVLTNWHVVDKAVEVRCLLYSGQAYDAKVVGSDQDTDLALVQLTLPADAGDLPCAALGDSTKLHEGDFVMAMGAPWGMNRSVSIGIISCTNRYLPRQSEYSLWLQTDASISPGNSGGPLINTEGSIIGINTLGSMMGGDLGFAVPSDTIGQVVPLIRQQGKVGWSWTGLQLQALRDFNRNIYFDAKEGVIVAETDPESPARRAGIQPRDRLLSIDGQTVNGITEEDLPAIRRHLGLLAKNKDVTVRLMRDEKEMTLTLAPSDKGKVQGEEQDCPRWNLTVKTINQFDNPDLFFHRKKGVFIYGIKYPGNAAAAGLQQQDILLKIESREIAALDDVKAAYTAAIDDLNNKHKLKLTILRNGLMRQIVLDYSRDHEKE